MKEIDKIAFIYLKDKKILSTLSKGKDTYYIPGGKREGNEADEEALIRECKEELTIDILKDTIKYYGTFKAQAHGKAEECVINNVDLHELRSCGKVLVAMAYGIAINDKMKCKNGEVLSLNTKVYDTLKPLKSVKIPEQVKEWTIKTLLTHSTGYEKMLFNEGHVATLGKFKLLDILFETPIKYPTDSHFTYSNVEPYLLSVFFKENFDRQIDDFIDERIFKPIGIEKYIWEKFGNYTAGATASYLNYKDFHKIGKLLFDYGKYDGKLKNKKPSKSP